ncbi:MAG: response regulator transcription factor [Tannerellaceae bacterium]|jgi:DNA-binding NarL/FixJ family response regulator|nr:response regulator transcription factor [Tannerellaceae bacterium]
MRTIILADNQDVTRAGIRYFCERIPGVWTIREAGNKKTLLHLLGVSSNAVVVLDYTLSDLSGVEELIILRERFRQSDWILFSEDLSMDFIRRVSFTSNAFSILLKDCAEEEINEALKLAMLCSECYICRRVVHLLQDGKPPFEPQESPLLTATELEILKAIALGRSTKEIATERILSMHTITTHRKNIFRKIDVNNVYEATKYALRAGIIDLAEYYI